MNERGYSSLSSELKDIGDAVSALERELDEKRRLADSWRNSAEGTGREIVKMRERAERAEKLLHEVIDNNLPEAVGKTLYEKVCRYFDPAPL